MIMLSIRIIKSFKLGLSLGCDRCDAQEKYILKVESGPLKGKTYLICEECMEDLKREANAVPIPVN